MMKGSNVRMKIQRLKCAVRGKRRKISSEREDIARIEEEAKIAMDSAELEWPGNEVLPRP